MIYFVTNRNNNQYQISDECIKIINQSEGYQYYKSLVEQSKELALDFEASGLEIYQLTPLLLAIGTKATQIVIDCTTVNIHRVVRKDIEDIEILGHNIKYDLKILKVHYDIHLKKVYDTMNVERKIYQGAGRSVDNPQGMLFGLGDVTQRRLKYLPETMADKEESRARFIGQSKSSYIPIDQDIIYAASDVTYLHDIKAAQKPDIERFNLGFYIDEISNPLNLVVADCELRGFTFDIARWKENIKNNKDKQFEKACVLDELVIKYRDEFLQGEDRLLLVGGEYTRKRIRHPEADKTGLFGEEVIDKDYYGKGSKPKFNTGNINWDSSEQVIDVCARLKIPLPVNDKKIGAAVPRLIKQKDRKGGLTVKIDKGNYSFTTDKQELALMVSENPKLPAKDFYLTLSEYRKYSHYISSFGENYIDKVNPVTGRIHTLFRTENSETGRFQSGGGRKNPEYYNAQNIPRDGDFRHCFIATPGYSITTCDLSGAEVTILCDKSQDETLYEWAVKNDDAHSPIATACWRNIFLYRAGEIMSYWKDAKEFFQKKDEKYIHRALKEMSGGIVIDDLYDKYENFTISKSENKEYRQVFKNVTFAVFYGARDKQVAKTLGVNDEEGAVIIGTMREAIPKTFEYLDKQVEFVMNNGYIYLDDRTNSRVWFQPIIRHLKNGDELTFHDRKVASGGAMNYPIQGTQASMVKEAILEIDKAIKYHNIDAHLLSTVHDELVYEQKIEWDGSLSMDKAKVLSFISDYGTDIINVSFPEFVKLTMCQVANRYLKHYKMGAEYHVTPYWTK